jgi:hypothetical protein
MLVDFLMLVDIVGKILHTARKKNARRERKWHKLRI